MIRRSFLTLIACAALVPPATAGETQLTAAEIDALLADSTATGVWSGNGYKQYFSSSGLTVYIPDGGAPSQGRWRSNAATNEYESWWQMTGWTPYVIVRTDDGTLAYRNGSALEPFTVKKGKHISW